MTPGFAIELIERFKLELRYDENKECWFILGQKSQGKTILDAVQHYFLHIYNPLVHLNHVKKEMIFYNSNIEKGQISEVVSSLQALRNHRSNLKKEIDSLTTDDIAIRNCYQQLYDDLDNNIIGIQLRLIGVSR